MYAKHSQSENEARAHTQTQSHWFWLNWRALLLSFCKPLLLCVLDICFCSVSCVWPVVCLLHCIQHVFCLLCCCALEIYQNHPPLSNVNNISRKRKEYSAWRVHCESSISNWLIDSKQQQAATVRWEEEIMIHIYRAELQKTENHKTLRMI